VRIIILLELCYKNIIKGERIMHYVYLNAQRFGLFLRDFEMFNEEERILCIHRIRSKYPGQVLELIDYFTKDVICLPEHLQMKREKR